MPERIVHRVLADRVAELHPGLRLECASTCHRIGLRAEHDARQAPRVRIHAPRLAKLAEHLHDAVRVLGERHMRQHRGLSAGVDVQDHGRLHLAGRGERFRGVRAEADVAQLHRPDPQAPRIGRRLGPVNGDRHPNAHLRRAEVLDLQHRAAGPGQLRAVNRECEYPRLVRLQLDRPARVRRHVRPDRLDRTERDLAPQRTLREEALRRNRRRDRRQPEDVVRVAPVPDDERVLHRAIRKVETAVQRGGLHLDDARPVLVTLRGERIRHAALRPGGAEQRRGRETRRGGIRTSDDVELAAFKGPLAEVLRGKRRLLAGDGHPREVQEALAGRRGLAPRHLRRRGHTGEGLRAGVGREDQVAAPALQGAKRTEVGLTRHPHVVGERLLHDLLAVSPVLFRVRVGVAPITADLGHRQPGEELRAVRRHPAPVRRRFEIDRVPPLRQRQRLADVRRGSREGHETRDERREIKDIRHETTTAFHDFSTFQPFNPYFASSLKNSSIAPTVGVT